MHIAIYLPSLRGGGAERAMVTLANGFAERGLKVDLVLASAEGPYLSEVSSGVNIIDLKSSRVLASLPGLVRYLRRERPQAMLSALNHANVIAVVARMLAGVPVRLVVSERNNVSLSGSSSKNLRSRVVLYMMRWAYRKADGVTAVSRGVADDLANTINLPRDRISVIFNPVVTPELIEKSRMPLEHPWLGEGKPPVILGVGRLTPQKDFSILIRAFARVRAEYDCRLVILGEGELRGELEQLVTSLGIQDSVQLPGFAENPFAWMSRVQLFVLSSRWEGLPNVLIQAMACGAAVVSTDCPSGPDEILERGKWGKLVPVRDEEALAEAIAALLEVPGNLLPDVRQRAGDFKQELAVGAYLNVMCEDQSKKTISKTTLDTIAVLGFAMVVVAIPWEEIFRTVNGYGFIDKGVYSDYFLNQTSVLDYKEFSGVLSYVSNEFLWHYAIGWLVSNTGILIDHVFLAISCITLLVFGLLLAKWLGIYALPLLVNPLVIDFAFSQYRLALAISILGAAYLLYGRYRAVPIALVLASLFIHSGTTLFILIYAAVWVANWLSVRFQAGCSAVFFMLFAVGAFISLLIGPLREALLSAIGDRRAEYHDMSSSLLYSLFWIALLIPFYLNRRYLVTLDYARYALVIVSIVFVNVFHSGYSTRFLAAAFPCLISTILSLHSAIKIMVTVLFIAYAMLQWLYWLRILGVMKKIVHIISGLNDGGAEAVLYRLCSSDKAAQHHVISLMNEGKYGPLLREAGVDVFCLNMPRGQVTVGGLWQLWRLLRQVRPQVVQTWMYHADLIGGVIARLAGVKRVLWGIHHTTLDAEKSRRSTIWVARLCARVSFWVPSTIVCCAQKALEVHRELGYAAEKLWVIPNGYDLIRFRVDEDARVRLRTEWNIGNCWLVGMVGRFDPLKDHENLLNALAIIKSNGVDFCCVLAGRGLDQNNVQLMAWLAEHNLTSEVKLLGQRTDIPDVMNALDVHVLSSSSEAFPNVVAEAMACGTQAVVTDVGDAAVIVGETGWVVPPKDPEALADALLQVHAAMRDMAAWQARCTAARQRVETHFSLERMIESYHLAWKDQAAE